MSGEGVMASDFRTHGASSAIDDEELLPIRPLVGPFAMRQDGHKVVLSFENTQYAELFVERHGCEPINALSPRWAEYMGVVE